MGNWAGNVPFLRRKSPAIEMTFCGNRRVILAGLVLQQEALSDGNSAGTDKLFVCADRCAHGGLRAVSV